MFTLVHLYGHFSHFLIVCLGILTCFQRAPNPHPHDHPHHSTSMSLACHYWSDNVLFSGLYRWNTPKQMKYSKTYCQQCQYLSADPAWRMNWAYSRRSPPRKVVQLEGLDSEPLSLCGWLLSARMICVPRMSKGNLVLVSSAWPWSAFFSRPHLTRLFTKCLACFSALL